MKKEYSSIQMTKDQKEKLKEHGDGSYAKIVENLMEKEDIKEEVKNMVKDIKKEIKKLKKDMEDKYRGIGIMEMKKLRKLKKDELKKISTKARRELKPFCHTCWLEDFENEDMHDYEYYTSAKLLEEKPILENNVNKSTYMEPIGVMRDYVCANKFNKDETDEEKRGRKHKISVEVHMRELEEGYLDKFKPRGIKK